MKSHIEKSRRRRKLHSIKYYLLIAGALVLGIPAVYVVISLVSMLNKPLFISPIPFFKDVQINATTDDDTVRNMIANELGRQHISFRRIDTSEENTYSIQLSDGEAVLVTKNKNIPSQIASLQVIYNRLTMEGKRFKKLDLRFSKPVITF